MRMTLIYPSVGRKPGHPYVRAWQMEPLSMALLASLTPPEVDLRFYDDRMETIPFDEPTDLVAISVETFTALRAYRLARQFRDRGIPVVMGGYHVTLCSDEARQMADSIVIGDADERVGPNARRFFARRFESGISIAAAAIARWPASSTRNICRQGLSESAVGGIRAGL